MNKDEIYNKPIILFFFSPVSYHWGEHSSCIIAIDRPPLHPVAPEPSPYYPITLSNPFTARNPSPWTSMSEQNSTDPDQTTV